jgi:hypothetical protein
MLLSFTIPPELTHACEIFASVYPRLFHLPALEYLLVFLRWDLAVIFEGQRAVMGWSTTVLERAIPVSFSLQRQISQPANVFPKVETCKPFPKLDFWYIPQGGFKINLCMGVPWRQRRPITNLFITTVCQRRWRNCGTSLILLFWIFHNVNFIFTALCFRTRLCFRLQVRTYSADPLGRSTVNHWACRRWKKSKISWVLRNMMHLRQNPVELNLSPSPLPIMA